MMSQGAGIQARTTSHPGTGHQLQQCLCPRFESLHGSPPQWTESSWRAPASCPETSGCPVNSSWMSEQTRVIFQKEEGRGRGHISHGLCSALLLGAQARTQGAAQLAEVATPALRSQQAYRAPNSLDLGRSVGPALPGAPQCLSW